MVRYSSSVLAAANLLALAQALPAQPVCSVVVQVVTGHGVWVPQPDPTWGSWDPSSKKPEATSTSTWGSWEDPSKSGKPSTKTTTTADWNTWDPSDPSKGKPTSKTTTTAEWSTWSEDPSKNTKTSTSTSTWAAWTTGSSSSAKPTTTYVTTIDTTTKVGGGFYSQPTESPETTTFTPSYTDHPTTTETPSTTSTEEPTTAPSTTSTDAPAATASACPYYDGTSFQKFDSVAGGGSCGSSFTVYCGARANPSGANVQFWERHDGELIGSLAECLQICDSNSECTAAIWTNYDGAGAQDKNHCWQTNGLPAPSVFGGDKSTYGQLSYKNFNSGTCSDDYTKAQ